MTIPELSKFLEPEEKESVLKAISENEKVMSSGVCNVLTNNNGDWVNSKPGTAVALFLKNSVERYYRILVVEPSCEAGKAAEIQLDFRINIIMLITKMHPKLLVFNNGKDIGLQFHNLKECEQFHGSISNRESLLPAVNTDEQGTSESSQLTRGGSVRWRETADTSSNVTEQTPVTNLVPAKVDSVETSDQIEKEKKVEKCKRIGAVRLPGADLVQLKNNRNRIDATSDEGRPSESADQEHVPQIMSDTTSTPTVPAHLPPSGPSELEHQEHVSELMSDPTSTPPVPAHRACWTVGTNESSQLDRGASVRFKKPERAIREQRSQSFCGMNMAKEQTKKYQDNVVRKLLLNRLQAEEENRQKSIAEASTASLENRQSAPEQYFPTTVNSSKITEQSEVTNHATSEGRPAELAHQEHDSERSKSTPPASTHRACWTVSNDPVPDDALRFHASKKCDQFHNSFSNREFFLPADKIDEQGTSQLTRSASDRSRKLKKEARKQRSQSIYDNMTEERRKEFHDTIDKIEFRSEEEREYGMRKLLDLYQAEEEKRKTTINASTSSLETSQSAPELNLRTAVTNLAEPISADVNPVETGDIENSGTATSDDGRPSELAHQEHGPEIMPDPTSTAPAATPRACWTVPNDPESPLESPKLEEPEPVVETEYEKYFAETEDTDAILIVKGRKLHVNKKFLSHRSQYFSRLFISIGKEYPTELVEHEDLAILLSLLMPEPFSLTDSNPETLLELADRFHLATAKPHLEQFLIGSGMDRFEKIRIAEKHQLENLLKNGIMEFNGEDVLTEMELNPSYKNLSDRVKVQILSRVLRMKK